MIRELLALRILRSYLEDLFSSGAIRAIAVAIWAAIFLLVLMFLSASESVG